MKRALLAAGAVLILAGPAFADEVTIEKRTITRDATPDTGATIEKRTITREAQPESGSTVSTVIVAPTAPPAPEVETPPPAPAPTAVWMSGHWNWSPDRQVYVWSHGRYAEPPRARATWIPGRFVERPDGWVWQEGRWD